MMYSQWSGHGLPRSTGQPAHKFDPYAVGYKDKVTVVEEHFPVKSCSSHSGRNSKGFVSQHLNAQTNFNRILGIDTIELHYFSIEMKDPFLHKKCFMVI